MMSRAGGVNVGPRDVSVILPCGTMTSADSTQGCVSNPALRCLQNLGNGWTNKIKEKIEYANSCSGAPRYVRDRVEKNHGKKMLELFP